jgi:hypothetical protein
MTAFATTVRMSTSPAARAATDSGRIAPGALREGRAEPVAVRARAGVVLVGLTGRAGTAGTADAAGAELAAAEGAGAGPWAAGWAVQPVLTATSSANAAQLRIICHILIGKERAGNSVRRWPSRSVGPLS